jgi:glycosyltransferase involved in cell wall biosynthesis/tetratricopeptide (TPR) repeat protein
MICKNSAWHLQKTVESARPVFDELIVVDTGSDDKTVEIAKNLDAEVHHFSWIKNFAAARNFSFEKTSGDVILWLDDDDILEHPELLREKAEAFFAKDGDFLWIPYHYAHDERGNVTTLIHRERMVRRGSGSWHRVIHEVFLRDQVTIQEHFGKAWVRHEPRNEDVKAKTLRNLGVIKAAIAEKGEDADPYLHLYAGAALHELNDIESSNGALMIYLDKSNWTAERLAAYNWLCENAKTAGRWDDMARFAGWAIAENPRAPEPWLYLAESCMRQKRYEDAIAAIQHMKQSGPPSVVTGYNPTALALKPHLVLFEAHAQLLDFDASLRALAMIRKLAPKDDKDIEQMAKRIEEARRDTGTVKALKHLQKVYQDEGNEEMVKSLSLDPPKALNDIPGVAPIYASPPDRKKIQIFCGETPVPFGPSSLKQGCGGSEEAVIHLSRELVDKGWGVEVYASTNEAGIHDGVVWNHWWNLNKRFNPCDVFVSWRNLVGTRSPELAKVRAAWMHDVPIPAMIKRRVVEEVELILPVSKYHVGLFKDALHPSFHPKIIATKNGLAQCDLVAPAQEWNGKGFRAIYASSPVRGLEELLVEVWPKILREIPDAELDVFYGFTKYWDEHMSGAAERRRWREGVERLLRDTRGVRYHGMVPQHQLAQAFSQAHFWLYPTSFPEVSCITAMKAQAMGAIPATSGYAALAETQLGGVTLGQGTQTWGEIPKAADRMVEEILQLWHTPTRAKDLSLHLSELSLKMNSWELVATQWNRLFLDALNRTQKILPAIQSPTSSPPAST